MLLFSLFLAGCASEGIVEAPVVEAPAAAPKVEVDAAALGRARAAMATLGKTLKGELVGAMQKDGPVAALEICSGQAGGLTASVADATGVRVGRSSLRLRNPANGGPPWVETWLEAQGEAAGR